MCIQINYCLEWEKINYCFSSINYPFYFINHFIDKIIVNEDFRELFMAQFLPIGIQIHILDLLMHVMGIFSSCILLI